MANPASTVAAHQAVESYFTTQFEAAYPDYPIAYPNVVFDPVSEDVWVRIDINETEPDLAGISGGLKLFRHYGVVVVRVYSPLGSGSGLSVGISEAVVQMFRDKDISGVKFKEVPPYFTVQGNNEFGWWQSNVTAPFRYDLLV